MNNGDAVVFFNDIKHQIAEQDGWCFVWNGGMMHNNHEKCHPIPPLAAKRQ